MSQVTETTLLQSPEIPEFTGISKEFPVCDLRAIFSLEYSIFVQHLGTEFYTELKADLATYEHNEYDHTKAYTEGETVVWDGIYRTTTKPTTGNTPDNVNYWTPARKFQKDCFEKLWCLFLGEYLSWGVLYDRLPFIARQFRSNGIVELFGDSFKSVSGKGITELQGAIMGKHERAFNNLHHYMTTGEESEECFSNYKGNLDDCCTGYEDGDCGDDSEIYHQYSHGYDFG